MPGRDTVDGLQHREHPRWPLSLEVHVQAMGWDERMTLLTEDLSLGGAFIRTSRIIEKGTYLQLSLHVPGRPELLAFAEVVRVVPVEIANERSATPGIGVQFLDPKPVFLQGLQAVLTQLADAGKRPLAERRPIVAPTTNAAGDLTFEVSPDEYRAAAKRPSNVPAEDDDYEPRTGDQDDDWWAASVNQLNRHRVSKVETPPPPAKDPGRGSAFDPLADALSSSGFQHQGRLDVEQALSDFAASIGRTMEPAPSHRAPPEPSEAAAPPARRVPSPPEAPAKRPAYIDLGKQMELYERSVKLLETQSYAPAHELAQELLKLQPGNKRFLVVLNLAAGGLYKQHGDIERATLHFQDAADIDESCKMAIEELRSIGMTRRQQGKARTGFLKKLKDNQAKRTR